MLVTIGILHAFTTNFADNEQKRHGFASFARETNKISWSVVKHADQKIADPIPRPQNLVLYGHLFPQPLYTVVHRAWKNAIEYEFPKD